MTQPVEAVVAAVVALVTPVTGIEQVPVNPPEVMSVTTFALVYAQNGGITNGVVGAKLGLHNIIVDVLTKRADLANDMALIKPYIDLIPAVLLPDPTLSGTAQTYEGITYERVTFDYAGIAVMGYSFILNNVKIISPN